MPLAIDNAARIEFRNAWYRSRVCSGIEIYYFLATLLECCIRSSPGSTGERKKEQVRGERNSYVGLWSTLERQRNWGGVPARSIVISEAGKAGRCKVIHREIAVHQPCSQCWQQRATRLASAMRLLQWGTRSLLPAPSLRRQILLHSS